MPTCYQRLSNSSEARQLEQFPAVNPASTAEPGWTATGHALIGDIVCRVEGQEGRLRGIDTLTGGPQKLDC